MRLDVAFEKFLWNSRLIVLIAVLASLVGAMVMFYVATVDMVELVMKLPSYHDSVHSAEQRMELRSEVVTHIVEVVDGYLLAAIMLIFSFGLYELFISRIDPAEESTSRGSRVLLIHSLDDLKDRLAKVVLLILVVKFFEYALRLHFETPLDLLYLAMGVFLLSAALYLSHGKESGKAGQAPGA